jgi:branched-chain amino acid transport system ATP-binding protein
MLLECHQIVKHFGALVAVNNLTFSIEEGETLGIMGPNGAGKSTLMNLIMGVFPLTSGKISFAGETISGLSTTEISRRGIGRTYQVPQPFPTLTVIENLMVGRLYSGKNRSMRAAHHHALGVLERVGLAHRAETTANQLGILDLKRLELARALSLEPRLLLLDEIFGGLVDREVEELQRLIAELKAQKQTMLIIEHVLNVLFSHSDRIIVMNFGEKLAEGTPTAIAQNERVIEVYLGEERGTLTVKGASPTAVPVEPLLHVSQISAGYGSFQALFDISLDIYPGEIVALMGLNGAGKTTLIRSITRQIPLMKGDIVYKGKSIARRKAHHISEIGIAQVLEGRKIFPLMTVQENLEMGAYPARARPHLPETLERVFQLFPVFGNGDSS